MKSRTTRTDYVLTFSNRTVVTPVVNPPFSLVALRLRSIGDILRADRINESEMFDVVALVVGRGDPREMQSKTGKDLKRLGIVVEDLEQNRINCALFDGHVDGILPHLDEPRDGPLIVVLHYFKATRWNGKTSLQSNFDVSKVHINPDISKVVAFRV
ncbi:hypothetical protein PIB30_052114 [Stylosanthes scabra]|uniref:Uncharacterized protein n=1 Tax=Stylosanthes scabra TaxID=79078 RepID=A0ABU6UIH0_9FABA|nr:hypothetical protein [Stylosanthes scabra]